MTNEVTTGGGSQLPAFLQAHLQANGGKPTADVASLATAQNSTPRLSLRGKIFRFMEGQDEVYKNKEAIHVHIVGVEPGPGLFTKTYYQDPYAGADSAGSPPDCSSADGVRPDPWIQQPVHHECKSCPKNQFGSATSRKGKASKACHDSKRLMIVRADSGADVKDVPPPQRTLYLSQIPVSSLRALSDYGKRLQEMGIESWMAVTKLTMDEDSEFPTLIFDTDGFVKEADMAGFKERAAKREWARSRDLMLTSQAQRPALPSHLAQTLGTSPAAAAAPVAQPVAAAATPVAQPVVEPGAPAAPTADNGNILSKW